MQSATKNTLEELKQIGADLKKIKNKEYSYHIETYVSYLGDTIKDRGTIYFCDNPKDTSIGLNFYNKSKLESFYNGEFIVALQKTIVLHLKARFAIIIMDT